MRLTHVTVRTSSGATRLAKIVGVRRCSESGEKIYSVKVRGRAGGRWSAGVREFPVSAIEGRDPGWEPAL